MSKLPTVWVSQEREDVDFSAANSWGNIEFVTNVEVPTVFKGRKYDDFVKHVREWIPKYNIRRDYLVFAGNPLQMVFLGLVIGALSTREENTDVRTIQVLKWMRQERQYNLVHLPLP